MRYFAEKHLWPNYIPVLMRELTPPPRRSSWCGTSATWRTRSWPSTASGLSSGFGRRDGSSDEHYVEEVLKPAALAISNSWRTRGSRAHLVRYEDMVLRPQETLTALLEYLELERSPQTVDRILRDSATETDEVRKHRTSRDPRESIGRWQREGSDRFRAFATRSSASSCAEFGYTERRRLAVVIADRRRLGRAAARDAEDIRGSSCSTCWACASSAGRSCCRPAGARHVHRRQWSPCPPEQSVNARYMHEVMEGSGSSTPTRCCWRAARAPAPLWACARQEASERVASSSLFLNVNGFVDDQELLAPARRRVFLDIDPGFGQMWHELGLHDAFRGHDAFVTVGREHRRARTARSRPAASTGSPRRSRSCWSTGRSPRRPATRSPASASWRGPFGPSSTAADLRPARARVPPLRRRAAPLRPAVRDRARHRRGRRGDIELLRDGGWPLVDPGVVARDPWAYRDYVQGSKAEFMVAKNMYVQSAQRLVQRPQRLLPGQRPARAGPGDRLLQALPRRAWPGPVQHPGRGGRRLTRHRA